jgi:hypothetical protein
VDHGVADVETAPGNGSDTDGERRAQWAHWAAGAAVVASIVAAAWIITGPAPKAARPAPVTDVATPPLVLRDGEPAGSVWALAAADIAAGRADLARARLAKLAAVDPAARDRAQAGELLAGWRTAGPQATATALAVLAQHAPNDPAVLLEAGLAQIVTGHQAAGLQTVANAERAADAARPPQFDLARHADDLLHPAFAPGYPLPVASAADARTSAGRRVATSLLAAISSGDRPAAGRLAASAATQRLAAADPAVAAIRAAAEYDKSRPLLADADLASAARAASPGSPGAALLDLQRGVVLLWNGDRSRALTLLHSVARSHAAAARWRAIATQLISRLGR